MILWVWSERLERRAVNPHNLCPRILHGSTQSAFKIDSISSQIRSLIAIVRHSNKHLLQILKIYCTLARSMEYVWELEQPHECSSTSLTKLSYKDNQVRDPTLLVFWRSLTQSWRFAFNGLWNFNQQNERALSGKISKIQHKAASMWADFSIYFIRQSFNQRFHLISDPRENIKAANPFEVTNFVRRCVS